MKWQISEMSTSVKTYHLLKVMTTNAWRKAYKIFTEQHIFSTYCRLPSYCGVDKCIYIFFVSLGFMEYKPL